MRIVTLNANGIRAAARKGVFDWVPRQRADVICLQEIRAQVDQLTDKMYFPRNWHVIYESAERKGYAGVALYSRREPDQVALRMTGGILTGQVTLQRIDGDNWQLAMD